MTSSTRGLVVYSKWAGLVFSSALFLSACDDKVRYEGPSGGDPGEGTPGEVVDYAPQDCDPINTSYCALPWPSNLYLKESTRTVTGVELEFGEESLPSGLRQIQPRAWQGLDGYGPSTPVLFHFPGLDLSRMPSELAVEKSVSEAIDQAALFEVDGDGQLHRVPFWVERDPRGKEEAALIYLRPAVVLEEGGRYIVALQNLQNTRGESIERAEAFDKLVNNQGHKDPELVGRQARFNEIFDKLETVGMKRQDLTLAWDFQIMSHEMLHGPMLRIRDLALADLNGGGAAMTITRVTEFQNTQPGAANYEPNTAFQFEGTFQSPWFMREDGAGNSFNLDAQGQIVQNGYVDRPFWIRVPWGAVGEDASPAGFMQYGHGLLGEGNQVRGHSNGRISLDNNWILFAASLTGMSSPDLGAVASVLSDFTKVRLLTDNLHQGIIEWVVLAKAMKHTFPTLPEVVSRGILSDPSSMYYSGISQGGIFGATYVAVSPDIHAGHLGVPGVNYNMLLPRSTDFDGGSGKGYQGVASLSYRVLPNLGIALAAAQTLWDMTDPSTYYRHLEVDPFPGNPVKHVLLAPAKGDFQVAPVTNLMLARSGYHVAVMKGWNHDGHRVEDFGLSETPYLDADGKPYRGSGVVLYDMGNPWAPIGNQPPAEHGGLDSGGLEDPHGLPRYFAAHQRQLAHFLKTGGEIIDVCEGQGCHFREDQSRCDGSELSDKECWFLTPFE